MQIFRDCIKRDAFYNATLPYGIISAAAAHMLLPKTPGMLKPILTAVIGVTMSFVGKLFYIPKCYQKAFGHSMDQFKRYCLFLFCVELYNILAFCNGSVKLVI